MSQDANRPLVIGSQLVGVLVVIITLLTRQAELRSTRPVGDKKQVAAQPDKNGDYFARLWDDPLALLPTFELKEAERSESAAKGLAPSPTKATETENKPPVSGPESAASPAGRTAASTVGSAPAHSQDQKTLVRTTPPKTEAGASPTVTPAERGIFIWNILDARPLPEIKENRLRIRYSVVSALVAKGYLPTNESLLIPLGSPVVGYYETFRLATAANANSEAFRSVTLVWVPKQSSEQSVFDPQKRKEFQKQIAEQSQVSIDGTYHLLHHGGSDDFRAYLNRPKTDDPISFVRATIPQQYLPPQEAKRVELTRPIIDDDKLVQALVGELCLRIPALNKGNQEEEARPRIIICTESDTNYGRAVASGVSKGLDGVAKVETYTYLRGLDGRPEDVPNRTEPEQTKPDDIATSLLRGKAISEASIGTSQFDYLRRLSLHLEQEKRKKGGEICAVGVLGTDIYDKMLVLQALRPQLASAVFFTTDLDALYLEQPNQNFTRNLIVASADGLEDISDLSATGNWNLPPMRDSYQTVLVRHVWAILSPHRNKPNAEAAGASAESGTLNPVMKPARLFEIVAGKSINLKPVSSSDFSGKSLLGWLASWGTPIIFLLGLGNAFLILWAISTRKVSADDPDTAPMNKGGRIFVHSEIGLAVVCLISLLVLFVTSAESFLEEPLTLEASVWPSITMRLLAVIVAIRLLMIASKAFVVRSSEIEQKLTNNMPSNLKLFLPDGVFKEMAVGCKSVLSSEKVTLPPAKTLKEVFSNHFDQRARRKRIMWASLGYLACSFVLFICWPPAVPARGAFTFLVEKVVLALGVGLYIIHLMYCLDLHISACTVLRTLRSFYSRKVQASLQGHPFDTDLVLSATSELTAIIGKTLLYPLTILILIIISRLRIFDNWTMTPSLSATFLVGAAVLIFASLVLWREGVLLKAAATKHKTEPDPAEESENSNRLDEGVFAPWHRQPIFAALLSGVAVFGSLTVAEPLVRLFVGSP